MAFKPSTIGVDLTPAEAELRRVYTLLQKEVIALGQANYQRVNGAASLHVYNPFNAPLSVPVLHIVPKGRRVEYAWYRQNRWESQSSKIATALGANTGGVQTHDEVFLAGEALGWAPDKLVELMIHQIVHQIAQEGSETTHHSKSMERIARYVGYTACSKHATQGFTEWKHPDAALIRVIEAAVQSLDKSAFNLVRKEDPIGIGTGRMKQWQCACSKPKVYTGGVIMATCERCQKPFVYSHKDRHLDIMRRHLNRKGLPDDRIAAWWCSNCSAMHDWANYPTACQLATATQSVQ